MKQLITIILICLVSVNAYAAGWKETEKINTVKGYQEYLSKHPEDLQHSQIARQQIETLKEQVAWENTCKENRPAAYQQFLQNYPHSGHAKEAKKHLAPLIQKALLKAVTEGNEKDVDSLLAMGVNVDAVTDNESSNDLLMIAARQGNLPIVKKLIDANVDVNKQNNFGNTALIFAVSKNHSDVVKYLIKKKADLDIQNKDGLTALMVATYNKNPKIAEVLLSHGADMNIYSETYYTTAKKVANDQKHPAMASVFKKFDIEDLIADQDSARVKYLFEHGAKIDQRDRSGDTLLDVAARFDNAEIARYLIDKGVGRNEGEEPMLIALNNNSVNVFKLLFSKAPNTMGSPPKLLPSAGTHVSVSGTTVDNYVKYPKEIDVYYWKKHGNIFLRTSYKITGDMTAAPNGKTITCEDIPKVKGLLILTDAHGYIKGIDTFYKIKLSADKNILTSTILSRKGVSHNLKDDYSSY